MISKYQISLVMSLFIILFFLSCKEQKVVEVNLSGKWVKKSSSYTEKMIFEKQHRYQRIRIADDVIATIKGNYSIAKNKERESIFSIVLLPDDLEEVGGNYVLESEVLDVYELSNNTLKVKSHTRRRVDNNQEFQVVEIYFKENNL